MSLYKIYHEDYIGDKPKEIEVKGDHWCAALEYAEWYNTRADYALMDGGSAEIFVEDKDGKRIAYTITAEPDTHYRADEK